MGFFVIVVCLGFFCLVVWLFFFKVRYVREKEKQVTTEGNTHVPSGKRRKHKR